MHRLRDQFTNYLDEINISDDVKISKIAFRPMCPIKINGVPTFALLDSGNTVAPAISKTFARKIFNDRDVRKHLRPMTREIGSGSKNAPLDVMGITKQKVKLKLGNHPHELKTHLLVINHLNSNVNISGPFMMKHGMDQLHSKGCLRFNGKNIKLVKFTRDMAAEMGYLVTDKESESIADKKTSEEAKLTHKKSCSVGNKSTVSFESEDKKPLPQKSDAA